MPHAFGGDWTEDKLAVMRRYFAAYAQALKNQRFARWYVDAFAGTGERTGARTSARHHGTLFGEDESDLNEVKLGSARIALQIEPPFSRYILIERSREHVAALSALKASLLDRKIDIRSGDANTVLQELCQSSNWRGTRAAVFIDPYGMQVSWATLEALASTNTNPR